MTVSSRDSNGANGSASVEPLTHAPPTVISSESPPLPLLVTVKRSVVETLPSSFASGGIATATPKSWLTVTLAWNRASREPDVASITACAVSTASASSGAVIPRETVAAPPAGTDLDQPLALSKLALQPAGNDAANVTSSGVSSWFSTCRSKKAVAPGSTKARSLPSSSGQRPSPEGASTSSRSATCSCIELLLARRVRLCAVPGEASRGMVKLSHMKPCSSAASVSDAGSSE